MSRVLRFNNRLGHVLDGPVISADLREYLLSDLNLVCQLVSSTDIYESKEEWGGEPSPLAPKMKMEPKVIAAFINVNQSPHAWKHVPEAFFSRPRRIGEFLERLWKFHSTDRGRSPKWLSPLWRSVELNSLDDLNLALKLVPFCPETFKLFSHRIQDDHQLLTAMIKSRSLEMFDGACENQWRNCLLRLSDDSLKAFILETGYMDLVFVSKMKFNPDNLRQLLPRLKGHDAKRVLLETGIFHQREMCLELIHFVEQRIKDGEYDNPGEVKFAGRSVIDILNSSPCSSDVTIRKEIDSLELQITKFFEENQPDSFAEFLAFLRNQSSVR